MGKKDKINIEHTMFLPATKEQQFEAVSALIAERVKEKTKPGKLVQFLRIVASLVSITFIGLLIWKMFLEDKIQEHFTYENVDKFSNIRSIGKEDLINELVDQMITTTKWIQTENPTDLKKIFDETNFSFLLYGPPGTGKTIFAKEVAYRYNLALKKLHMQKTNEQDFNRAKNTPDFEKYVNSYVKSRVNYLTVYPSMILDKYVGESSKNVKRLFSSLSKNISDEKEGSIALFDEGDALFYSRDRALMQTSDNSMAIQSEFLSNLSQQKKTFQPLFVFVTTNFANRLDPAFLRRLGKKIKFELPTLEERKKLIRHIWNELKIKYTEKNITELAEATKGTSHSFISKTLKEFTVLDKNRPVAIDFLFDECIIHCKQENIKV